MERLGRMDVENRYLRQEMLEEVGSQGQKKLQNAKVIVVGAGGLGSPVLSYLCAAGVGTIAIVDDDIVDISNLQRQILYREADLGQKKIELAKKRLLALNSGCTVHTYPVRLTNDNAESICAHYHLIIDCTDNIASRYVINSISAKLKIPFIYGGIMEFFGQVSVFNYPQGIPFTHLYPNENTENYSHSLGVMGALPGVVGSIQAMEALKIILQKGDILSKKLLSIDLLNNKYQIFEIG